MRKIQVLWVVFKMNVRQLFCRHLWTDIRNHPAQWAGARVVRRGYVDQVCVKCLKYREHYD